MSNETTTISEINIVPVKARDGLIGFVSFVLNDNFYVGNVAIFQRRDGTGIRLVYPNRTVGGKQVHCLYPIKREVGEYITKAIQTKFDSLFSRFSEDVIDYASSVL